MAGHGAVGYPSLCSKQYLFWVSLPLCRCWLGTNDFLKIETCHYRTFDSMVAHRSLPLSRSHRFGTSDLFVFFTALTLDRLWLGFGEASLAQWLLVGTSDATVNISEPTGAQTSRHSFPPGVTLGQDRLSARWKPSNSLDVTKLSEREIYGSNISLLLISLSINIWISIIIIIVVV